MSFLLIPKESLQSKFKNSSQCLISEEFFNELKEKRQVVPPYILKGRIHDTIPNKEEITKFHDYFNDTVYPSSAHPELLFNRIWKQIYYFHIEELDPKIDDKDFPTWIPLESRERKVFYAQGEGDCLYQYSLVQLDDETN